MLHRCYPSAARCCPLMLLLLSPLCCPRRPPGRVLQQLCVYLLGRQLNVADNTAANETVADGSEVRMLVRVYHLHVVQLDVEVLVDRVESAAQTDVILQLDHYGLTDQRAEEVEELLIQHTA